MTLAPIALAAMLVIAASLSPGRAGADPALWLVKGAKANVYLFGTVHLMKTGVVWTTPAIDKALAASDDLWLEVGEDLQDPTAILPEVQSLALDPTHPLSSKISKADLDRFDALIKAAGLPGEAPFEVVRPWFAGFMAGVLPAMKQGYSPNSGIDVTLRARMKDAGKPVRGLETLDEQLHFLADLPEAQEVAFFHEQLEESARSKGAGIDTLETLWQNGDVAEVAKLDEASAGSDPEMTALLLTERNAKWAKKLDERLHGAGTSFVAVGMAHLAGPGSVIDDLSKLGYTVTRVQ